MSHTDKDRPAWVKAQEKPERFAPLHAWDCSERGGVANCDLPQSTPEGLPPGDTRCRWHWLGENGHELAEVYGPTPQHGCDNPRCTRCTHKRTQKRKDRNRARRELQREIRDLG